MLLETFRFLCGLALFAAIAAVVVVEVGLRGLRDFAADDLPPAPPPGERGYRAPGDALREDAALVPYGVTARDGVLAYRPPPDRFAVSAALSAGAYLLLGYGITSLYAQRVPLLSALLLLLAPPALTWLTQRRRAGTVWLQVDERERKLGLRGKVEEPLQELRFDEVRGLRLHRLRGDEGGLALDLELLGAGGLLGTAALPQLPLPAARRLARSLAALLDLQGEVELLDDTAEKGSVSPAPAATKAPPRTGLRVDAGAKAQEPAEEQEEPAAEGAPSRERAEG